VEYRKVRVVQKMRGELCKRISGEWIVKNRCCIHRRGDDEGKNIWERPAEEIEDLTTREEFFNEYWWTE